MADFFPIIPTSPPPLTDSYLEDWGDDDDDDYGGFASAPSVGIANSAKLVTDGDNVSDQSSERGPPETLPSDFKFHFPKSAENNDCSENDTCDKGSDMNCKDETSRVSVTDSGVYSYDTSPDIKTCTGSKVGDLHNSSSVGGPSEPATSAAEMSNGEVFDHDCNLIVAEETRNVNVDCQNASDSELDFTHCISESTMNLVRTVCDVEMISGLDNTITHDDENLLKSQEKAKNTNTIHSMHMQRQEDDIDIANMTEDPSVLLSDVLYHSNVVEQTNEQNKNNSLCSDELFAKESEISKETNMFDVKEEEMTEETEKIKVEQSDDCKSNGVTCTDQGYIRSFCDDLDDKDDDDDDDDFADFSSSVGPSGVALLADDSDNCQTWDAFADVQSNDDTSIDDWATFQDTATNDDFNYDSVDDDEFGDFEGGADAVKTSQETMQPAEKSDKTLGSGMPMISALLACFPQTTSNSHCDNDVEHLSGVLTQKVFRELATNTVPPSSSSFDYHQKLASTTVNINVWFNLKDLHSTVALKYQWQESNNRQKLIRALQMDPSNMLFHARKPGMPAFASGLGMLEPSRGGHTAPSSEPIIIDTSTSADSDSSSQDIPAVDFDWTTSGLTNPLDALQKEQEILNAIDAEPAPQPAGLQPLHNILANLKFVTTTPTSEPAMETLDQQVVKALSSLPDLSFMSAKVLMFPLKGDSHAN